MRQQGCLMLITKVVSYCFTVQQPYPSCRGMKAIEFQVLLNKEADRTLSHSLLVFYFVNFFQVLFCVHC